jgi:SAM-dependent methyltransferase
VTAPATTATRLNLAAGNRILSADDGWINHDRWAHRPEIDVTHDLREYPWPWDDNSFTDIVAFDIIEHVLDPLRFIEELWRIAAPGATVYVHTAWASPHIDNRHVWRDPTHVRPFHEESFHYFDPVNGGYWFSQYGKFYSEARFALMQVQPEPPDCIGFHLRAIKE